MTEVEPDAVAVVGKCHSDEWALLKPAPAAKFMLQLGSVLDEDRLHGWASSQEPTHLGEPPILKNDQGPAHQ